MSVSLNLLFYVINSKQRILSEHIVYFLIYTEIFGSYQYLDLYDNYNDRARSYNAGTFIEPLARHFMESGRYFLRTIVSTSERGTVGRPFIEFPFLALAIGEWTTSDREIRQQFRHPWNTVLRSTFGVHWELSMDKSRFQVNKTLP